MDARDAVEEEATIAVERKYPAEARANCARSASLAACKTYECTRACRLRKAYVIETPPREAQLNTKSREP